MHQMFALPSFLAFLLPLPAAFSTGEPRRPSRRRRAIHALHLPSHILRDVGLDEFEDAADDGRWARHFDLER